MMLLFAYSDGNDPSAVAAALSDFLLAPRQNASSMLGELLR
jgi:hypothetical protein